MKNLKIGQSFQGGIIAYILQPCDKGYSASVQHGLIATPSDQSTGIDWDKAVSMCDTLTLGGYHDWHLPSKNELNKLSLNMVAVGGFSSNNYWSATENGSSLAWGQTIGDGDQYRSDKNDSNSVRAVRAF